MSNAVKSQVLTVDVLIVGGGIAGLWTLARLRQAGYNAVLLESHALGAGQTRYAQGIIHGGTKYALTGKLTASSEAVANMPALWRDCLAGRGELDLSQASLLSDTHYLWSSQHLGSKLSGFFASKIMRSKTSELDKEHRPSLFMHDDFKGRVYALDEPVFDTLSVVRAIAEPLKTSILSIQKDSIEQRDGKLAVLAQDGQAYTFDYRKLVLMAGSGNRELLMTLGRRQPEMQLRPLKMVMLRQGLTDRVYAHCTGASVNPRITITSHYDKQGDIVWYLGGQLAEEGITRNDDEQIKCAKNEMLDLIPWLDLSTAQWAVLDIDRAEVKKPGSVRPDNCFAKQQDNVITAWPTKLALSPVLAQQVVGLIEADGFQTSATIEFPSGSSPEYAEFPWCEEERWN